ncbi:hypothetical protein GIB67_004874 [Kingdonia uniflora]|uniref:Carboxylesterase type B domain-containing protein n=1 Tax=Kingdonia uniflora TaxID=39325 RepID=A0A7J7LNF8_9MAGN|nr:hypothetical protein GIB67_004874 [Kingdonia uniflora]
MDVTLLKKICLFLLIVSASLLSTAGRNGRFVDVFSMEASDSNKEITNEPLQHEDASVVHGKLLRVNAGDYGSYDPAPALGKPRFKLIPNRW